MRYVVKSHMICNKICYQLHLTNVRFSTIHECLVKKGGGNNNVVKIFNDELYAQKLERYGKNKLSK